MGGGTCTRDSCLLLCEVRPGAKQFQERGGGGYSFNFKLFFFFCFLRTTWVTVTRVFFFSEEVKEEELEALKSAKKKRGG